jgi:hypothetical protein
MCAVSHIVHQNPNAADQNGENGRRLLEDFENCDAQSQTSQKIRSDTHTDHGIVNLSGLG